MGRPKTIYALYKGENNLADGTAEELAERFGVTANTIRYYATKSYTRRTSEEKAYRLVKIGLEEV